MKNTLYEEVCGKWQIKKNRLGYIYWACNAVWLSSNATLFTNVFKQVFGVEMGKMPTMLFVLAVIWIQLLVLMLPSNEFSIGAMKPTLGDSIVFIPALIITFWDLRHLLPISDISIIGGIIDTLRVGLGNGPVVGVITIIIGVLFLSVLFIQGMLWVGSPCNTAAIAAESGELPKSFTKRNKYGSPSVNSCGR